MAGRPKAIEDSRVFDISKPAQSKPLGTSRPVITQHDSVEDDSVTKTSRHAPSVATKIIQPLQVAAEDAAEPVDDMKKEVDEEVKLDEANFTSSKLPIEEPEETKEEHETVPVIINKVVKEEDHEEEPEIELKPREETEEQSNEHKTPVEKEEHKSEEEAKPEEEFEDKEKLQPEEPTEKTQESATVDALAENAKAKKETKESKQLAVDAKIQELVTSKKYFVPLAHDAGKKSGHKLIWILLVLGLIAGIYLMLDAGVVGGNVSLPFEFIK